MNLLTRSWGILGREWEEDGGWEAWKGGIVKAWPGLGPGLEVNAPRMEALISKCAQEGLIEKTVDMAAGARGW